MAGKTVHCSRKLLLNLIQTSKKTNDISNKTYCYTESIRVKKLWSKVVSSSELKFFIDNFILGHPVVETSIVFGRFVLERHSQLV